MPRQWYRKLFVDHPGYAHGDPAAFFGSGRIRDKVKVWCEQCYRARAADLDSRTLEQLWSDRRAGWIACRPDACLSHLQRCILQPQEIRDRALRVHALGLGQRRIKDRSRRAKRRATANSCHDQIISPYTEDVWHSTAEEPLGHVGIGCSAGATSSVTDTLPENPANNTGTDDKRCLSIQSVIPPSQSCISIQTGFPTTPCDTRMVFMTTDEPVPALNAPVMFFAGQDGFDGDFIMPDASFPEDIPDESWFLRFPEQYASWQYNFDAPF